jgi:hypothetical protein
MRLVLMHPNTQLIVLFRWLISALTLTYVPADFWVQVVAIMDVPEPVKEAVAPLMGSALTTAAEYVVQIKNRAEPQPAKYWVLKVFIGWVVGSYGGGMVDSVVTADPVNIAFWGGVTGHGSVALVLASQNKKIKDIDKHEEPT